MATRDLLGIMEDGVEETPIQRTNHLLVIGIDAYQHHRPLNNARRDAEAFRDLLTSHYQFEPAHVTTLFDEEATRRNIIATLEKLDRQLTDKDNLLIYFSGHGTMNHRKSQGFWIPVDAQKGSNADYLSNSRVRDMLGDLQVHHLYLIVDACFAGSMILRQADQHIKLSESSPSRRVLSSGRQEVVSDGQAGSHSPFFLCLQHQLSQTSNSLLTAKQLELYVSQNTPRNAHQQPVAEFIHGIGDQSGQFVFRSKTARQAKPADQAEWQKAREKDTIAAYQSYRRTNRQGSYRSEALQRIKALEEARDWKKARRLNRVSSYEEFMDLHPTGAYAKEAEQLIHSLIKGEANRQSEAQPKVKPTPRAQFDFPVPEMVEIPGGSFERGGYLITLDSFELGKYPLTQREWEAIMGGNPSHFEGKFRPVEMVSWNDCQAYIQKLNQKTGLSYRLPTEAEWEYAAGGGSKNRTTWAGTNSESELGDFAWYKENSGNKTHPVGEKKPNGLGFYDLSGNVWEWCEDRYGDYPPAHRATLRALKAAPTESSAGAGGAASPSAVASPTATTSAPATGATASVSASPGLFNFWAFCLLGF